jgi:hypothetical protein
MPPEVSHGTPEPAGPEAAERKRLSTVLKRLIEEVRIEGETGVAIHGYNRTHTRHNRS